MFGMGMGEIVLIAVVALLVLGPERLPAAAKAIGKGIRDLRAQTKDLQETIEQDTQIGDAVREIRGALRGDPETLYKKATGEDFRDFLNEKREETLEANDKKTADALAAEGAQASATEASDTDTKAESAKAEPAKPRHTKDFLAPYNNTSDSWGEAASNPHVEDEAENEAPLIRPVEGVVARDSSFTAKADTAADTAKANDGEPTDG